MNPLSRKNMLRSAMSNADMPTSPSLVAMSRPSLDDLRDQIHQCSRRVRTIQDRVDSELLEAKRDLKAAQEQMIDALRNSELGIDAMDDV